MENLTPTPTPTPTPVPPVSGVNPTQQVAPEVVAEMPANLNAAGSLSQFPATDMIESIRIESGGIRGGAPLLMLQTIVQSVERQLVATTVEKNNVCDKLETAQERLTTLSVENAELKKDVQHMNSEKNLRNAFVALGGLGAGVALPVAIGAPTVANIAYTTVFVLILVGALFFTGRKAASK